MAKTILVADDSRVFRALEAHALKGQGFELLHAEDGAQAVSTAAEKSPDLIVLDLQMPVLDGVQALKILKSSERTRDIPVLIVSAEAGTSEAKELLQHGALALLPKPVASGALLAAVQKALGLTPRLDSVEPRSGR